MASFDIAYKKYILPHEGGYASAADAAKIGDSGGETYLGIARNYNPTWKGWPIIDEYKAKNGTPKQFSFIPDKRLNDLAYDLSKTNYWDKNQLSLVNQQPIANMLMDISYNSGTGTAAKSVQRVLNLQADGIIGPMTISAINAANPTKLLNDLVEYRIQWLNTNQAGKSYLPALIKRAQSYLAGAADIITENKNIIVPAIIGIMAIGGIYWWRSSGK